MTLKETTQAVFPGKHLEGQRRKPESFFEEPPVAQDSLAVMRLGNGRAKDKREMAAQWISLRA